MNWVSKICITFLVFVGASLCFQALHHCERFEPESELYFYADTVVQVSRASYTFHGALVNMGDEAVIEHGFCWSDSRSPSIENDSLASLGPLSAAKEFSYTVADLQGSKTYKVKAYIETKVQVSYSDEMIFETPAPSKPEVSTREITMVTENSAQSGGIITDGGGAAVTSKGVCWDSLGYPDITSRHTVETSEGDSFTSVLSNLNSGTVYYVRAYAENSAGISYGDTLSFETSGDQPIIVVPTVSTTDTSNVTQTTANSGGNVLDEGGASVTAKGVCWSQSPEPEITDSFTVDGSGPGSYPSELTGLASGKKYYVRAYATNSAGTGYGEERTFTTLQAIVEPTVGTNEIIDVTQTTAKSGGNVLDEGGAPVTAKGVCWSQSPEPEIADSFTVDGSGPGSYPSELTGLTSGKKYYVRAYATNSAGTGYGEERTFTTPKDPIFKPTVSTTAISNLTETSVQSGGNVTDEGGASVTAKGICWSKSPEPDINDNITVNGEGSGSYTSVISDLSCNTTYYLRAYATNSAGTGYGDPIEIKTAICTSVKDYDDNEYEVIKIGEQVWMAENLKVSHYADGRQIENVADSAEWVALGTTNAAFCWYDNNQAYMDEYGALYNWTAAMDGESSTYGNPSNVQGVCPDGWHLPSDNEWKQLEMHLGMSQVDADDRYWRGTDQGTQLKEAGYSHWLNSSIEGTNTSQFTALPGGVRRYTGYFEGRRISTYFWTTSETTSTNAWDRYLYSLEEGVHRKDNNKGHGCSVRCVMND